MLDDYQGTCSITNLKDWHVTYIKQAKYLDLLKNTKFNLLVVAPKDLSTNDIPENVVFHFVDDPNYEFTLLHNKICETRGIENVRAKNIIADSAIIHPTVILDVDGLKLAYGKDGKKISFIHTGNVIIGEDVEIGPYSVIHRGVLDSTEIKRGAKIGAKVNIGHNNIIGEDTVFAVGILTCGSVTIGKRCWLGTGVMVRNGITVCDDVVLGIGSVVTKSITKPGIYTGHPARFVRSYDKNNFTLR